MSMPRRSYEYAQLDVFAEAPLEGNMLAIFTDASGLTSDEMQALARETNLSETTFIVPRPAFIEAERGVQVRIFTVNEELRFAGHPTLGTASWLYWNHSVLRGAEAITLDLQVGPITVRFPADQDGAAGVLGAGVYGAGVLGAGVFATMQQNAPSFGALHSAEQVAAALNLSVDDLDSTLPIQTVSTGMAFCIVPLRSLEVSKRLNIPQHSAQAYLDRSDAKFFYCIAPLGAGAGHFAEARWHNRMQFYNGEDPATGSASGCAIAYLVQHGRATGGETVVFEQGIEIGRPSRLQVTASLSAKVGNAKQGASATGNPTEVSIPDLVFVGGRTILVASGRFFLP
jgi:trans-2,3-dihydro-3-hydroxyanthranilate isomerase